MEEPQNRLNKILEGINGMPKYEWDRIVQEVEEYTAI